MPNSLPGGHSEWEPPDSISNSEVKTLSADDSVGFPHVKVGHCRAFILKSPIDICRWGFFLVWPMHVLCAVPFLMLIVARPVDGTAAFVRVLFPPTAPP